MAKRPSKQYPQVLKTLMAEKSRILSQAQAFSLMGLEETARPLWLAAAGREEQIAPHLEVLGRDSEAALHRVSAASCYEKSGEFSRAANLYRAAMTGPLPERELAHVRESLSKCLAQLPLDPLPSAG